MDIEHRKPSKQRRRHEHGYSGIQNGLSGMNFSGSSFKPLHGAPFSRDETFQQTPIAIPCPEVPFSAASPQGPIVSGHGMGSGRRSGGSSRSGGGRHSSQFGSLDAPSGPMWSHLTASPFPSVPPGIPDDFGVVDDDPSAPAHAELDAKEEEVCVRPLVFRIEPRPDNRT